MQNITLEILILNSGKFKTSKCIKSLENTAGLTCFKHHAGVQNKIKNNYKLNNLNK